MMYWVYTVCEVGAEEGGVWEWPVLIAKQCVYIYREMDDYDDNNIIHYLHMAHHHEAVSYEEIYKLPS